MISKAEAITRVEARINEFDADWPTRPKRVVDDALTLEKDWGWILFYGVPEDFQLGHEGELAEHNPPFMVSGLTGEFELASSDEPLEYYVERFAQTQPR